MKRFLQLILLVVGCYSAAYAQSAEICDNGIDDDKDGLIDCFDPDCSKFSGCSGGYVGNDLLCEAKPSEIPEFSMELESTSKEGTSTHLGRVLVGDVDGDGSVEMVTVNTISKKIFILNGENPGGASQKELSVSYQPAYEDFLMGNINNDKCSEIYILSKDWKVRAYDCNLNEIWSSPLQLPGDPGMMGLADFNGDGKVELYARNAIYNAHTGATIVAPASNDDWKKSHGGPVAVDILNDTAPYKAHTLTDAVRDDNLELVCGGTIYSVNISGGSITSRATLPNFAQKKVHDATSIADYNNDGSLDVIASGKWTGSAPADKTTAKDNTTIFFWDVKNNTLKTYSDAFSTPVEIRACDSPSTGDYYKNGWKEGTGRVNIADIDGDGTPNAVYVSGKFLYALKNDFTLLWKIIVNEETSGNTGCTLFDFNGDGKSEIVYRDEKYVYIIDGKGEVSAQKACTSRTSREYPIVADVDNDNNTELCVTCRNVDFYPNPDETNPSNPKYDDVDFAKFCDNGTFGDAQVRIFRSAGEPWVPARKVWNQHGYFNVNVNDNLSIPKIQQKHHLVFSTNVCTTGANRPLNSFLNQSPFLNSKGCPKYASPDLAHVANTLVVTPPMCPSKNFQVSFQITNVGDLSLTGTVPITFYNGYPMAIGAKKLNTVNINLSNFKTGAKQTVNATVQGPGTIFTLYIVLNDNGNTVPSPITMPNTNFIECDYDNNIIQAPVTPLPVPVTAIATDNIRCTPGSTADNGSVQAYVMLGGVKNSTDFTFYWSAGTVAKPMASADHKGATWTLRPDNTYMVYAVHNAQGCFGDTTSTVVTRLNKTVDPDIFSVHDYDQCSPPNGAVRVVVNDGNADGVGEDPNLYNYAWYEGNDIYSSQIGINDTLSGLKPIAYTVLVTHKATACVAIESFSIPDKTVVPTVTATAIEATCSDPLSGSVSASVSNVTAGYTFKWYKGTAVKATPDFTGVTYANRPVGKYTVTATRNSSKCVSPAVTVEVVQSTAPIVTAVLVSDQTSCDPTQPTGAASANVGGTTTGYTFEWFKGQNTIAMNRVAATAAATGLSNVIYTVKATSIATGCFATAEITIGFDVQTPTLATGTVVNPTQCAVPNGSITMTVSLDDPDDYTFFWYKGTSVKPTPDFADTDATLSGLAPGDYTVKAINNIRHCMTPQAVTVNLIDNSPVTSYNLDNIVRPSTCNDSNGQLEVSVSAPGNTGGFDFEWRLGQAPYQAAAIPGTHTATNSVVANLKTGAYTVIVKNRDNGCESSHLYDLPFDDAQILAFLSKTDITNCIPGNNGDARVTLTKTPGFDEEDYRIDVFEGANDLGASATPFRTLNTTNGTTQYTAVSPLLPGSYTFVAVTTNPARSTYECRSVPVTVNLKMNTQNPALAATTPADNMTCSATVGSGQIAVSVTNPTSSLSDYTFTWHEGDEATDPTLGTATSGSASGTNGSTAINLPAGSYTVVARKNSGASAGCASTATYLIFDNNPVLSLASADLAVIDITQCDMMTNGSVQVNNVSENGTQFPAANYTYAWFMDSPSGPQPVIGNTTALLSGLGTGKVFVQPTNTLTQCSTPGLVEAVIADKTMNTVSVALMSFTTPSLCLKPTNTPGDLTVEGSGSSTTGYTYNWFAGSAITDPALPPANVGGATGELAQNLVGGTYTVEVVNNSTQCKTTDTYVLPTERMPVLISATAEPLTVCYTTGDGAVFAAVTSGNKNDYTYNWYNGTVKASPDFTGTAIAPVGSLMAGTYIVIATDNGDATCTASDTVTVSDKRIKPIALAIPASPVTICDPARPDGAATVSVDGDFVSYNFDWYASATPAGASFYTGSDVNGLRAITYSVIATSISTGCSDTTQVSINNAPVMIPMPQIDVLSLVTSCVEGNGSVSASVGGNTSDYTFNWYNGTALKTSPDFTGEIYDELIVGNYSVTATSLITGCVSALATAPVGDSLLYPEFTWTTHAATCMRDASEKSNGLAAVFVTNGANIDVIQWQTDDGIVAGPILEGVNAGTYTVTVTTFLGCSKSQDIEIATEIHPYNGISRNGDNQNELFMINCIESFPLNHVKIFNRAGTLVYEADGYDNSSVFFDGTSNKGLSIMGTELPGGTYFYIIDKRDGSKPLAGYLELIQ